MSTTATAALGDLVGTAASLASRLEVAYAVQWQASPRPRPRMDTTERSKGGPPSDPTADTVTDEPRLGVRAAVKTAEDALGAAVDVVVSAEKALDRALEEWHGPA